MNQAPLPEAQRWSGPHLYKYGSVVDWLEELIVRHTLHVPTVNELNDPNDSRPRVRVLNHREVVRFLTRARVQEKPELAGFVPELTARMTELCSTVDMDAQFRWAIEKMDADLASRWVYSMSTRWDNLKMWAQYANNHKGYCLEFLNDPNDRLFGMARAVIYDDSYELDLLRDEHSSPVWYIFKHPDWRCEQEVRIVLPRKFGGPKFALSPSILTRVILGRNMPPDDAERIRVWGASRKPPLPVAVTTYDQFTRAFGLA
jgi:hypothetical protein